MNPPTFNPCSILLTEQFGFDMPMYAPWLFNHICAMPNDRNIYDSISSDMHEMGASEDDEALVTDAFLDMANTLYTFLRLNTRLHFLFAGEVLDVVRNDLTGTWELIFQPETYKLEHVTNDHHTWGWLTNVQRPIQYNLF